jgi:hypothetical protein
MASRQAAVIALAMRGASNPEELAAYIASRARGSRGAVEMAVRYPVTSPNDVLIARSATGGAAVRHRRGGGTIGEIRYEDGWRAVYGGKPSVQPHTHQRGALAELLGLWNSNTTTLQHPGSQPLQPPAVQTPLMQQYQVPAIRALATPATSASSGPRVTMANGSSDSNDDDDKDDGSDDSGLTPKGQGIKKKLLAKGWTDAKATMFAKRAQSFGGAKS